MNQHHHAAFAQSPVPPPLTALADALSQLPDIGPTKARTIAHHLVTSGANLAPALSAAVIAAAHSAQRCSRCQATSDRTTCAVCSRASRRQDQVMVVTTDIELLAIERSGAYGGTYHVLHGELDPHRGILPQDLTLSQLAVRAAMLPADPTAELIIATPNTLTGNMTSDYITRVIAPLGVSISRVPTGLANRSSVRFSDPTTLAQAIINRLPLDEAPDPPPEA